MKICIIHDWLTTYGGSELVLKCLLELWPETPVYTLVYDENGNCRDIIQSTEVRGSFINKLPFAKRKHRSYLPLMPLAIEQFDLSAYDLVLSDSHAIAKGVITGPDQLHISYIHTPVRYAWDLQHQYLKHARLERGLRGFLAKALLHYIRMWDMRTVSGVDHYIANSKYIARRIWKLYKREAKVIHPPVEIDRFQVQEDKEDFYLTMSRLVPYKKVGLMVEAFNAMPDKRLVVIGDGPELKTLKRMAAENITFLGFQSDQAVADYLQRARALVYAAEEDFGIVPVEAQACGTPVIAYGKGGALETVIEGETGFFFQKQTPESLVRAVETFENQTEWDHQAIRRHAEGYSKGRFKQEILTFVEEKATRFFES
ncbi:MAG: glycosyltransferase family 4 protein [Chloroflexota bacterium]|jgi:glycosyltransferase involved in cell wall biosynthesis|nr:glycosyltransferase family 4 protein [Chloroflexota bacterium]